MKARRVKATALLRPEIHRALKARADRNERDLGYEIAIIVADRIRSDEAEAAHRTSGPPGEFREDPLVPLSSPERGV